MLAWRIDHSLGSSAMIDRVIPEADFQSLVESAFDWLVARGFHA
jgi:hypothetical protein